MFKGKNLLIAIVSVLAIFYYSLVTYVVPNYIKQMLPTVEVLAQDYINGSVHVGGISWGGGLSARLDNVLIQDKAQQTVAELPQTVVHFRPWLILGGVEKVITKIELAQPQVYLVMDKNLTWNMQNLLKPSDSETTPFYGLLEVDDAKLQVELPNATWNVVVNGGIDGGANPHFAVDMEMLSETDALALQGTITTKGIGNLTLKTNELELAAYSPALEYLEQVYENSGKIKNLHLHWSNNGKRVQLDGVGDLQNVSGKFKTADAQIYAYKLNGSVSAIDNIVKLNPMDVELAGQAFRIITQVDLADLQDIKAIKAQGKITAQKLALQNFQAIENLQIPFAVDGESMQVGNAEFTYGGGKVVFNGNYNLPEQSLLADVNIQNVAQQLPNLPDDTVQLNGSVAVLASNKDDVLNVQAAADAFDLQWRTLKIHKLGFDGSVANGVLHINHFSALAGKNGSFLADGTIAANGALRLKGRMAEFPVHPFLDAAGQQGSGLCSTGFNIGGTASAPEFSGMVQFTDVSFMKQKLTEAHGVVAMRDNVLSFKNFVALMEQGKHILNGSVDLRATKPLLNLSLETYGVRAEPLVAVLSPDVKVTGNVNNIVQLTGSTGNPSVSGEVMLTDGSAYGYLIDKVQGRYAFHEGQIDLRNFMVDALSAKIVLDGTMTKEEELDFTMRANDVNIERLPIMASDIDLRGLIDLNGKLSGTLTYPRFQGDVNSSQITVNGEILSELSGSLDSNGRETNKLDVRFKQPYANDASNYGLFTADLNLDLVQKYMHGKVMTLWGNLGGILRMAKLDYAIEGTTNGELDFNPRGKGSGVDINVYVDEVKIHDLDYYRMLFKGKLLQGVLTMQDVRLQEQEKVEDKGIITLGGTFDLRAKKFNLNMDSVQASPAVVTAFMQNPPEIKGAMDLQLALAGTFASPSGKANLVIKDGSISGVSVDEVQAQAVLENDNIHLQHFTAMKDVYGVMAAGDIPVDLFRSSKERHNPDAQMQIDIDLQNARLGMLPALTKLVEWGEGETEGKLNLAGTLEEPLVFGSIKIVDGKVKLADFTTVIDKINTELEFKGNEVLLHNFTTQLGKGSVIANGNYALRAHEAAPYRLYVKAQDADIASEIFSGTINSEIEIIPQKYREHAPRKNNKPAPIAYRPLLKGNLKLDDVLINMPTIPEMGEGGSNIGFDMQVDLGKKIHFFNKYLYDMWLSGNVHLKGSSVFPVIEGQVRADKGSVTYLRTPFKLKKASVNWLQPGSFLPNVNVESEARFSRYDIYMRITGPVENMDLQLSSNPPQEKNTIVRMLTLQRDSAGSDEVSSEDMANLMTAGLQMTVLGDVEMLVKQTLGFDQFRIYTGKVRSGIGFESVRDRNQELTPEERNSYNMLISKYLGSKLMAGYTTSFNGIDRSFFGQYDINRRMNFTYSRSYDLSDEAEDWFGLEYRVNFN